MKVEVSWKCHIQLGPTVIMDIVPFWINIYQHGEFCKFYIADTAGHAARLNHLDLGTTLLKQPPHQGPRPAVSPCTYIKMWSSCEYWLLSHEHPSMHALSGAVFPPNTRNESWYLRNDWRYIRKGRSFPIKCSR